MENEKQYLIKTNEGYIVKDGNPLYLPSSEDVKALSTDTDRFVPCGKVEEPNIRTISLFKGEIGNISLPEGFLIAKGDDLANMNFRPGDKLFIRQLLDGRKDIDMIASYNAEGRLVTACDRRRIPFIKAFFLHLHTVNRHRRLVRRNCFKVGLYRQGLIHDLSKYSPAEFLVGVKYYQGLRSPNVAERMDIGYSTAWMHHKGRNKHHHEYWTDYSPETSNILEFMEMPKKYFIESIMDRIAASMVYRGKTYNDSAALDYLLTRDSEQFMNIKNREEMIRILTMLAEKGEKETFAYIKNEYLK